MEQREVIDAFFELLKSDEDYAWTWHCNIAMAMQDSGVDHKTANIGAGRFMEMLAGRNTNRFANKN